MWTSRITRLAGNRLVSQITNNFTYPVILVDDRDPDTSWANHIKRGSSGGVDLAYPYGSPVYAPTDGTYQYFNGNGRIGQGSGGNIGRLRRADGSYLEFMHMAAGTKDRAVKTGDLLGKSGASGFGKLWHYAPHLHVHIYIGGIRRNLWDHFTPTTSAASTAATPITNQKADDDMTTVIARIDQTGSCYVWNLETGIVQHIPDTYQLGILQSLTKTVTFAEENQFAFIRKTYGATFAASKPVAATATIDAGAVANAVAASLKPQLGGLVVDTAAIAKAVDSALADNFAAIPAAVVGGIKTAL